MAKARRSRISVQTDAKNFPAARNLPLRETHAAGSSASAAPRKAAGMDGRIVPL